MRIYLAGKIKKNCWRHSIVRGLREGSEFYDSYGASALPEWPVMKQAIFFRHDYVGPYFISCDHGGYHGDNSHGVGAGECDHDHGGHGQCPWCGPGIPRETALVRCLHAIDEADFVYAWIESFDCFGTITEIGYAFAHKIPVIIATPDDFEEPDMWFPLHCASSRVWAPDARQGLVNALRIAESNSFAEKVQDARLYREHREYRFRNARAFCRLRELCSSASKILSDANDLSERGNASWRDLISFAVVRPLKSALAIAQGFGDNGNG